MRFSISGVEIADMAFYTNVEWATERRESIETQIKNFNIQNLQRFDAIRHEVFNYSPTYTGLKIFEKFLESDAETLFVLEDDAIFTNNVKNIDNTSISLEKLLINIMTQLEYTEWDTVLFCTHPLAKIEKITDNLGVNTNSIWAQAFLVNRKSADFIINNFNYFKDYSAIDNILPLLNNHGFKSLLTLPKVCAHGSFKSTMAPDRGIWEYEKIQDLAYKAYLTG